MGARILLMNTGTIAQIAGMRARSFVYNVKRKKIGTIKQRTILYASGNNRWV
jgi:hypothetical protein